MPFDRTLGEVFAAHSDTIKDEIRKVLPATVTAVYPALQTVDVVLGVLNPIFDEFGEVSYEVLPAMSNVPLACLRGGGFFVWLPVAAGDTVLLLFSDLSLDTWRAGTGEQPVEPGYVQKHGMDSAVAIPILVPDAKATPSVAIDPTKCIIGKDGSPAQIKISATDIELGATVTDAVALASRVDAGFAALVTAFNTHTHPVPGVTTGTGATTSSVPTALETPPATVASVLVKAQ